MGIPLLISHFGGCPQHLRLSLKSAAKFNPEVVLIGDESNVKFWGSHWNSDHADVPNFRKFMQSYVKMSDYPDQYETAFWKRPFMVEEWMKREQVKEVFLIDSDVLSFADYSKEVALLLPDNCRATLMVTERKQEIGELWSSLHFSYWTRDALEDFTAFSVDAYRHSDIRMKLESKYRWHIENRHPGGVCEMTLLHFWAEKNSKAVINLAKVMNDSVADLSVAQSANYFDDEYAMRGGFKRLVFRGGIPYGFNKILNREIRFWCLHCQGDSKGVMGLLRSPGLRAVFPELFRIIRLTGTLGRNSKSCFQAALRRFMPASRPATRLL